MYTTLPGMRAMLYLARLVVVAVKALLEKAAEQSSGVAESQLRSGTRS